MSSLENLPIEITRHIFLALDKPSDLLHVALTCKSFYELIIPTHHLDLTSISCCDSETPLEFWQRLCVSRHYASMVRQIELRDQSLDPWIVQFHVFPRHRFHGRRVDEEFVRALDSDSLPVSAVFSSPDPLKKSLTYMHELKSVSITKGSGEPYTEYERLRYISEIFSDSLETLHILYRYLEFPSGSTLQYKASDFSFHCLTSFSLYAFPVHKLSEPFALLLDSLASNCHTLVNFAFQSRRPFPILRLVKRVNWPSLKKLTLIFPANYDTSREEDINLCLAFFARHSQLEQLYLMMWHSDVTRQSLIDLICRLPPLLPSLRSLRCDCPIPLDILSRLTHASSPSTPAQHWFMAQSLRSCVIGPIRFNYLEGLVEALPQLERLSVLLDVPWKYHGEFKRFWDKIPKILSALQNLTHLELRVIGVDMEDVIARHPLYFRDYHIIPRLSYVQLSGGSFGAGTEWLHITADPDDPGTFLFASVEDSPSPDPFFKPEHWGEFFGGPMMRLR